MKTYMESYMPCNGICFMVYRISSQAHLFWDGVHKTGKPQNFKTLTILDLLWLNAYKGQLK